MGALTAAEDAAARGGGGALVELGTIANDVAVMRQQVCLPRAADSFGVTPANEPAYIAGYWEAARGLASLEGTAARERLRTFAERFPDAPGVELLACDLELRARRLPAASKRCGAAVAKCKESGRAHYLMGMVAANGGKHAVAEQSLQKAIKLDPTDEGPGCCWRASTATPARSSSWPIWPRATRRCCRHRCPRTSGIS